MTWKDITWKEIIVMSLGVFVALVLIEVGIFTFDETAQSPEEPKTVINHVFTDNMKDCQEKGGIYQLEIMPNGKVWDEKCKINGDVIY